MNKCCSQQTKPFKYTGDIPYVNQQGEIICKDFDQKKLLNHPSFSKLSEQNIFNLKSIGIIYNPGACLGKSKVLQQFECQLQKLSIEFTTFKSESQDHLEQLAFQFDFQKFDACAVCGGDGTQFLVINAMAKKESQTKFKLIVLPGGTGNDLYRSINPLNLQKSAKLQDFDVGKVSFKDENGQEKIVFFGGQIGIGFGGNGNARARGLNFFGKARYDIAALLEIKDNNQLNISMDLNGQNVLLKQNVKMIQIQNIKSFAGGMILAPYAQVDDNLFDVLYLQTNSRIKLVQMLQKVKQAKHVEHQDVFKYYRVANHIKLYDFQKSFIEIDGELFTAQEYMNIEIIPNKFTLIQ